MVSAQAAPNLLPLLDKEIKPEKVVLLVTPQMEERADFLEQVISPRGIKVERHNFEVSDDFNAMQNQLMDLIEQEDANEIALNATGGTKWMAIAAQEIFRSNGSLVFYVKVEDDQLLFVDEKRPSHKLSQQIDLKNYIQSYGYELRGQSKPTGLPKQLRKLCEGLVLRVKEWQGAIGQLNFLASEAQLRNTLTITLDNVFNRQDSNLHHLLSDCFEAGLFKKRPTDSITFTDEQAREFANGGWLEFYTNSVLNELKTEGVIQDSPHLNQHIQRIGATSHNEIDVCFMARNRLHLIECKTKRMSGKGAADSTTDTVYKLDSISELGGLGTKSMLVSYRGLNSADKQRARDLRIEVVEVEQIQQLKSRLRNWIQR